MRVWSWREDDGDYPVFRDGCCMFIIDRECPTCMPEAHKRQKEDIQFIVDALNEKERRENERRIFVISPDAPSIIEHVKPESPEHRCETRVGFESGDYPCSCGEIVIRR